MKRIVALLLAAVMIVGLAACGSPKAKEFSIEEMKLTLTADFKEGEYSGYTKVFESKDAAAFVLREDKSLLGGETMALVSDAGTPGISDPGFLLVRQAIRAGVEVITLPGATAFVPALVSSGLPCDKFCFEGFLPQKKGRMTRLEQLKDEPRTIVFYESPHRVAKALEQFAQVFGPQRQACACREISKVHEESVRGTLAELLEHFRNEEPRGEFVIIVAGNDEGRENGETEEQTTERVADSPTTSLPEGRPLSKYQRKQMEKENTL